MSTLFLGFFLACILLTGCALEQHSQCFASWYGHCPGLKVRNLHSPPPDYHFVFANFCPSTAPRRYIPSRVSWKCGGIVRPLSSPPADIATQDSAFRVIILHRTGPPGTPRRGALGWAPRGGGAVRPSGVEVGQGHARRCTRRKDGRRVGRRVGRAERRNAREGGVTQCTDNCMHACARAINASASVARAASLPRAAVTRAGAGRAGGCALRRGGLQGAPQGGDPGLEPGCGGGGGVEICVRCAGGRAGGRACVCDHIYVGTAACARASGRLARVHLRTCSCVSRGRACVLVCVCACIFFCVCILILCCLNEFISSVKYGYYGFGYCIRLENE